MSKISRGEKGEQKVKDVLNKIDVHHHLLNDITLISYESGMSHQIDHILIHPHGLFVIETKNYYGKIVYLSKEKQWFTVINNINKKVADPLLQNKSHAVSLYKALKGKYKVIPIVVFVKNNAPYIPDENVINLDDLLLFIESYPYEHKYTDITIDKIKALIENAAVDITRKEHVENISYLKQYRKELYAEKQYAIEKGMCPRCNSKMLVKGYQYKCCKCDFSFKI